MIMIRALLIVFALFAGGCAYTSIETPIGKFWSSRNSTLNDLHIKITEYPDGRKETEISIGRAVGDASTVIDSQTAMLRAAIIASFEAASKGAGPGG